MEVIADTKVVSTEIITESEIQYTKDPEPELVKEPAKLPEYIANLDVCFMMDCTGSMQPYIDRARNKVKEIIEEVKQQYPESEVKVGIVGYRDIGDYNQFEILPFTNDIPSAKTFLDKISASGGNDCPEDVNGGFQNVLYKMQWEGQARMIVHIADAPCHGKTFHDTHDYHPNGHKDDIAWEVIFKHMVDNHMDYLFMKILPQTDKMFEKFKQIAEEQGASKNGVLFKQEAISNIDPTTTGMATKSLFAPVTTFTPAFAKPKPREKKDKESARARKPRAGRSSSKKPAASKTPTRKERAAKKDKEVVVSDEEDEDFSDSRYWTRSRSRAWREKQEQEKSKRKGSRGRRSVKKDDDEENVEYVGTGYWTIMLRHAKDEDEDEVRRSVRTRPKKGSVSKERERSSKRDKSAKKDRKRSTSKKTKKDEMILEKPKASTKKKVAPATKKVYDAPVSMSMMGLPPGMSALDEQEYFAKLLSKEMKESIQRKKDAKKML